jgi:hypothetical protein
MSDEFLGMDPNTPAAPTASATERRLAEIEAERAVLLVKKSAEDALKAAASLRDRKLAVRVHKRLCPSDHATLACPWYAIPDADDADAADWTEEQHRRWLAIAVIGQAELAALDAEG